jgi:hypothetical protein
MVLHEAREVIKNMTAWHSTVAEVHHNNQICLIAINIAIVDLRNGEGDKPLCPLCTKLESLFPLR